MRLDREGLPKGLAAAQAGRDPKTARPYRRRAKLPRAVQRRDRPGRTRLDPLADSRSRADRFPSSPFRLAYATRLVHQPARAATAYRGLLYRAARRREVAVAAAWGRRLDEGRSLGVAAGEQTRRGMDRGRSQRRRPSAR